MITTEIGLLLFTALSFVFDVRFRKIPNGIVFLGLSVATGLHLFAVDGEGWTFALLGGVVGLGCAMPLYLLGAIGAGDAKWFAAAGAFAGPVGAGTLVLASVLAGGIAAAGRIAGSEAFRRRCLEVVAGCYVRTGWERFNIPAEGSATFPFLVCGAPVVIGYVFWR